MYDRVVGAFRAGKYSPETEKAYVGWIRRFIAFYDGRHPRLMGEAAVGAFLTHLGVDRKVAAKTQNQALSALLFLYRQVLERPLERMDDIIRAKVPRTVPQSLPREEVAALLREMSGVPLLVTSKLYGSGARLEEGLSVRVKDLDFSRSQLVLRDGKGAKDRVTMLPGRLHLPLQRHLIVVKRMHEEDLARGLGEVPLPFALARKYPNAATEWSWQWVFPARSHYLDRETGKRHRYHLHPSVIQKAIREAARRAGITRPVRPHILRHSFATHLIEDGCDIRTLQTLLGHDDVRTTMKYLNALNGRGLGLRSPLDALEASVERLRAAHYADRERRVTPLLDSGSLGVDAGRGEDERWEWGTDAAR